MKNPGITIDVNTRISDNTAMRALKVLEWYCQDNGKIVVSDTNVNGDLVLYIADKKRSKREIINRNAALNAARRQQIYKQFEEIKEAVKTDMMED